MKRNLLVIIIKCFSRYNLNLQVDFPRLTHQMANTPNIELLSAIKKQLDSLEDSFYDGIPNELLQNAHLMHFSYMMNVVHSKIISIVKNSIQNVDVNKPSDLETININYSQLAALSKKDNL